LLWIAAARDSEDQGASALARQPRLPISLSRIAYEIYERDDGRH
jgi:hypothetical protein